MEEISASADADTQPAAVESNAHRHTPGPWFVEKSLFGDWWVRRDDTIGQLIRENAIEGRDTITLVSGSHDRYKREGDTTTVQRVRTPEAEADARLIAAAPDYAAAAAPLVHLVEFFGGEDSDEISVTAGELRALAAAHAKATAAPSGLGGGK